jgi:hypothetical protein
VDRVKEIQAASSSLPPDEYRRVFQWFRQLEQTRWDEQMDRDSAAGKLDVPFEEAEIESAQGLLRDWPPHLGDVLRAPR